MKKRNKIAITVGALIASFIILVAVPISVYGPVNLANNKLEDYELLCSYIGKFKESEGRLPNSFQQIGGS